MEKTRFEPFAAGELRVLRMACYEAGAAFGDPGHTAEDRATLDDLAVEIIGELKKKTAAEAAAPKEIQIAMQVEKTVVDQPEKPLTFAFDFGLPRVVNPEVQIVAPEKPNPAPETGVCKALGAFPAARGAPREYKPGPVACRYRQGRGTNGAEKVHRLSLHPLPEVRPGTRLCANSPFLLHTAASAAHRHPSATCARSRFGVSAAPATATSPTFRTRLLICLALPVRRPWPLNGTNTKAVISP